MKLKKHFKAFTLVELIIVITILAILATIAFISFQGYVKDSRDSTRLTTLKNIEQGLQAFQVKTGNYPDGESMINILGSGVIIGTQGYFGDIAAKSIGIRSTPVDPLDQTKFVYALNTAKTKYQLVSFLEKNNQLSLVLPTYAADYSQRIPKMFGSSLGVILDINNNPITTAIDVVTYTGSSLKAVIDNTGKGIVSGTGYILGFLKDGASKNCNEILQKGYSKGDGVYLVNPTGTGSFGVYCDMTTDGGGWTLVVGINGTNNNHTNSGSVTPENLTSLTGYGKYSDQMIQSIFQYSYRLETKQNRSIKHIWEKSNCIFSSIGEATIENGCLTIINGGANSAGRLGIVHKDGSVINDSYVYGYNPSIWGTTHNYIYNAYSTDGLFWVK